MNVFIETIKSSNEEIRNRSFFDLCEGIPVKDLIESFEELEKFRQQNSNLYEKVRAEIFLYAGYKFVLMNKNGIDTGGIIPVSGYKNLLERNFEKSISEFRNEINRNGYNANILSALAESYHKLAFQSLANQVKKSVKQSFGNRWMFRVGHPEEHPLKIHPLLMQKNGSPLYPVLRETSAVRMDLTHNCWSDIFFLGMDYPEGAKVINISIDLGVYGRDNEIKPPIETYLRVIDEPVIRLTSIDLNDTKDITELTDLFNFANDYLGLLKAGIIASGLVPPSFESTVYGLEEILSRVTAPGMGIEIVTKVNDIPKGSRLAVSTNLLASIISLIMRATKQTNKLEGELTEQEKRLIVSRAILGEWLGGSGGGWQDSGGIWAGIKIIEGVKATEKDPEFNISRGCLLPKHKPLTSEEFVHKEFEQRLLSSLILFHGGMASNVGPVLEMVTEKYLLRSSEEWKARQFSNLIFNEILEAINRGDIEKLAQLTSTNFDYPIKTIIPEATNHFTELIIRKCKEKFGDGYKGFLMLGGISGGGMGMFVEQGNLENRKKELLEILYKTKNKLENALPFAMDPVVYNFQINKYGSLGKLLQGNDAVMPLKYYSIIIPSLLKGNNEKIPDTRKIEFDLATEFSKGKEDSFKMLRTIVGSLFRFSNKVESFDKAEHDKITERIKKENGFDFIQHEDIRKDLIRGKIGLARNRLTADTIIEDVKDDELELLL